MTRSLVVFRYDDYGTADGTEVTRHVDRSVLDLFADKALPVVIAAIPEPLGAQPESIQELKRYHCAGTVEIALHGWDHRPSEHLLATEGIKSEFTGFPYDAQIQRLLKGKSYLEAWFDQPVHTFVPPWNRYDLMTLRACEAAGIQALSADIYGPVSADSTVALLPSTMSVPNLSQMISGWERNPKAGRLAVVCFHSFDLVESGSDRAVFSLKQLDEVLARMRSSSHLAVADFRTASIELHDKLTLARFEAGRSVYRLSARIWSSRIRSYVHSKVPVFRANLDSAGYETEDFYRALLRRWQVLSYLP